MLRFAALCALLAGSHACVYLFGEAPNSLMPPPPAGHFDYGLHGDDWNGTCASGKLQSPLTISIWSNIYPHGDKRLASSWRYSPLTSNGTNLEVFNNGHTIQVQWASGALDSDSKIATLGKSVTDSVYADASTPASSIKKVKMTPLQFHFHSTSEHNLNGLLFVLEMHIVHTVTDLPGCDTKACLTVTGIGFRLADDDADNAALAPIFDAMPVREGEKVKLPAGTVLNIEALMPKNRSYVAYEGSLTTPPCTEGLLWHVYTHVVPISMRQFRQYMAAVSFKECEEEGTTDTTTPQGASSTNRRHLSSSGAAAERSGRVFVRGARDGFVEVPLPTRSATTPSTRSRLLVETGGTNNWVCTVGADGYNNRNVQPRGDRMMKLFS